MIYREDPEGIMVITQPAHAWLSGQLARAWGNDAFGDFVPRAEVELAAELHDLGFVLWEQEPTLDVSTGLPHSFMSMPLKEHLEVWSRGVEGMLAYGLYPALLVSMHYTWLTERHSRPEGLEQANLVNAFLDDQASLQSSAIASLRLNPHYDRAVQKEVLDRNRKLVSLWDWLSLLLCMGKSQPESISEVPTAEGLGQLLLKQKDDSVGSYSLSPWPFRRDSVQLVCPAKRLANQSQTTEEMRAALRNAPVVSFHFELTR